MYTFLERKFPEDCNGDILLITIFMEMTKNKFFAIFLSKQARNNQNSENLF